MRNATHSHFSGLLAKPYSNSFLETISWRARIVGV